jgi:hypothetical protein
VILTDPLLLWPGRTLLEAGAVQTLGPLAPALGAEPGAAGCAWDIAAGQDVPLGGGTYRLLLRAPGRFVRQGGSCDVVAGGLVARCRLGQGRVTLLADADMIDDALWSDGAGGAPPAFRTSDNLAFVMAWWPRLDGAAAPARPIAWRSAAGTAAPRGTPAH